MICRSSCASICRNRIQHGQGSGYRVGDHGLLSPPLYQLSLDLAFQEPGTEGSIFYRRFMDDFVILANAAGIYT